MPRSISSSNSGIQSNQVQSSQYLAYVHLCSRVRCRSRTGLGRRETLGSLNRRGGGPRHAAT
uniref:Uncharacterized protein n=1 Tax=Setaria italica TaxID=4555 RepID=K3ZGS2_SETIT